MQTKRVLVVEDDETLRTTVAEALQLVRAAEPDAIVLDLMMPVMDGRAFLEASRAWLC